METYLLVKESNKEFIQSLSFASKLSHDKYLLGFCLLANFHLQFKSD